MQLGDGGRAGSSPSACHGGSAAPLGPGAGFQAEVSLWEGWEAAGDDVSGEGGYGGARWMWERGWSAANRKRRPRSVSPSLQLASREVCFHFQNESEGGEVSPGLSPLQDTEVVPVAVQQCQSWQLFAALLVPKPLPVPPRCRGRAARAASVSHPAHGAGPSLWVLAVALQLCLGFKPVCK